MPNPPQPPIIDVQALKKHTDELIDAISSPAFVAAMHAMKATPPNQRLAFAAANLTPTILESQGVRFPAGMRITSRYFEPGVPQAVETTDAGPRLVPYSPPPGGGFPGGGLPGGGLPGGGLPGGGLPGGGLPGGGLPGGGLPGGGLPGGGLPGGGLPGGGLPGGGLPGGGPPGATGAWACACGGAGTVCGGAGGGS
jgi:hypothetical protein